VSALLLLLTLLMVQTDVRAHVALAGKATRADVTAMRPVAGMDQPVLLQVCQLRERLAARLAPERTFTCMSSKVYLHIAHRPGRLDNVRHRKKT